jgi:hypothetical protein
MNCEARHPPPRDKDQSAGWAHGAFKPAEAGEGAMQRLAEHLGPAEARKHHTNPGTLDQSPDERYRRTSTTHSQQKLARDREDVPPRSAGWGQRAMVRFMPCSAGGGQRTMTGCHAHPAEAMEQ